MYKFSENLATYIIVMCSSFMFERNENTVFMWEVRFKNEKTRCKSTISLT